jgi:hypothetical protein
MIIYFLFSIWSCNVFFHTYSAMQISDDDDDHQATIHDTPSLLALLVTSRVCAVSPSHITELFSSYDNILTSCVGPPSMRDPVLKKCGMRFTPLLISVLSGTTISVCLEHGLIVPDSHSDWHALAVFDVATFYHGITVNCLELFEHRASASASCKGPYGAT